MNNDRSKVFLRYLNLIWVVWGCIATILLLGMYLSRSSPEEVEIEPVFIGPYLACPKDMTIQQGQTWRNITVGISRLTALNDLYGVIAKETIPFYQDTDLANVYSLSLTNEAASVRGIAQGVSACVINGVIAALYVSVDYDTEMPAGLLPDWVQKYGTPDMVTWSSNGSWDSRTVLWVQEGIALDVWLINRDDTGSRTRVGAVVFFPPPASDQYATEWPFNMLPTNAPDSPNEGQFAEQENPFDFDSMAELGEG